MWIDSFAYVGLGLLLSYPVWRLGSWCLRRAGFGWARPLSLQPYVPPPLPAPPVEPAP